MSATENTTAPAGLWPWLNRYRIEGTLTCRSPLHIGSGKSTLDSCPVRGISIDSLVEADYHGNPIIPGSALRGSLRALLEASAGRAPAVGSVDARSEAMIDALFGPRAERQKLRSGKLCFEDAKKVSQPKASTANADETWTAMHPPYWHGSRGTYVITSVGIDPETGAAKAGVLYNMEVVPAGVQFKLTIVGSNLGDAEVAMLLWSLDRLNDSAGLVTLGAHAGRGFGRVNWKLEQLSRIGAALGDGNTASAKWREHFAGAGKQLYPLRSIKGETLKREDFANQWHPQRHQPDDNINLVIAYTLKLESNLVIRDKAGEQGQQANSGLLGFRLDTGSDAKRRGAVDVQPPRESRQQSSELKGSEVASLAWQIIFDGQTRRYRTEFQIPGSSLRGVFRGSLPSLEQESVFGNTDRRGRFEIENAVPVAPDALALNWHWQNWRKPPSGAGQNFRVETRGPVDRITSGAKSGGLHSFLSVERGSEFRGRILIRKAKISDIEKLNQWRNALDSGQLVVGGVSAAGYGRVSVTIDSAVAISCSNAEQLDDAQIPPDIKAVLGGLTRPAGGGARSSPPGTGRPSSTSSPLSLPANSTRDPHPHYMNPYDFVPFRRGAGGYTAPRLATTKEWENNGHILSGSISISLEALEPVHVSGRWSEEFVSFHRGAGGAPAIPGASLRGMLRAYIEALFNCWVSTYSRNLDPPEKALMNNARTQASRNPYAKVPGIPPRDPPANARYVGFNTDTRWRDYRAGNLAWPKTWIGPAIPEAFLPPVAGNADWKTRKIDLASFMFGTVLRVEEALPPEQRAPSLRGRVRVSDCMLLNEDLDASSYWIPDLKEKDAFIGGPKPSKSSMFYFNYNDGEIGWRVAGGEFNVVQFYTGAFRGRKFYFHQDWRACVESYRDPRLGENFWARGRQDGAVVPRRLESLKPGRQASFTIYFNGLPRTCLLLLLTAIEPFGRVRHKLGYAKPFGFGSIRLLVENVVIHENAQNVAELWQEVANQNWSWACDANVLQYSNRYLRYILTYPDDAADLRRDLFTYPGYKQRERDQPPPDAWTGGFAIPNSGPDDPVFGLAGPGTRSLAEVAQAKRYWDTRVKYTLDLGLYQRRSAHFQAVCWRAGVSPQDIHSLTI